LKQYSVVVATSDLINTAQPLSGQPKLRLTRSTLTMASLRTGRQNIRHVLLMSIVLLFAVVSSAQRTILQQGPTGDTTIADQGSSVTGTESDSDGKQQKEDKPKLSGKRTGFKKNGNAKQFLEEIGQDAAQQILSNAKYLNQPTLEEAMASFQKLLENDNDVVSLMLQASATQPVLRSAVLLLNLSLGSRQQ
jgi:hypothetical protein